MRRSDFRKQMLTIYELFRLMMEPFLPALLYNSRHDLISLIENKKTINFQLLDVGGRKSPYTIGLPADVTLIDLPRQEEIQEKLNLGFSKQILKDLQKKRSNISNVVIGDMLRNDFPDACFDGVVSIEVIEHIEQDNLFVDQIRRVLKPGGWFYLTTPNGDYVKNEPPHYNPDHKRHYTKTALFNLLKASFSPVEVWYGVKTGKNRYRGLQSLSIKHPLNMFISMMSNSLSILESRNLKDQFKRTANLFALAKKP